MINFKIAKKRAVSALIWVLIFLLIVFVGYMAFCNIRGKVAFVGEKAFIKIVSQSMEPGIPTGEYILVEKVSQKEIQELNVGDVIVFYSRDPQIYGKLNTHRIVEIKSDENGTRFVTKGDNNSVNDELETKQSDVVARYIRNSGTITKISNFFSKKAVFFLLILIPSAALVIICFIDVVKKAKAVKIDMLVNEEVEKMKQQDKDNNSH